LGLFGITPSFAVLLNIYNGSAGGIGMQFSTNGATPGSPNPSAPYVTTSPVNLASGDAINVRVYYNGSTVSVRLVDATNGATYSTSYNLGDLTAVLGAADGYVGFTAATGGLNAIQNVQNFHFAYSTAPNLSVQLTGGNVVLTWPVSVATSFVLQQASSLGGPWTNVITPPTVVGLKNQITVTKGSGNQFFRLALQ